MLKVFVGWYLILNFGNDVRFVLLVFTTFRRYRRFTPSKGENNQWEEQAWPIERHDGFLVFSCRRVYTPPPPLLLDLRKKKVLGVAYTL